MQIQVRHEEPGDVAPISNVHDLAFGGPSEGKLVVALRTYGDLVLSLCAELDGDIAGHAAFSRLRVSDGVPGRAVCLAPVGVLPARQSQGIGTALIEEGLRALRQAGETLVFVLGDPDYYGRFGFSADTARGFDAPWSGDAFQALWLTDPVPQSGGLVHYPVAFSAFE